MRPVNLIPPEERRGAGAPARTGALSYILVAALALLLIGVTATVVFGKKVSDKEDEVAALEVKAAETSARAESLSTYTTFQSIRDARVETVAQLATSRFDWERVMRELALVLPHSVWLTSLEASAGGEEGSGGGSLSGSIVGPSLVIAGCAAGQDSVAGFVTALKDIDGVTRVMTTAIALETSKGDLPLALGLGVVLIAIVLALNAAAMLVRDAAQRRYG